VEIVRFKKLCRFCGSAARLAEGLSLSAKAMQMRLARSFEVRVGADYSSVEIMSNTDWFFYLRVSAMQICNFLFSWRDFTGAYKRLNSYELEIL
jgi:hypothetical protein